jgi:hypothetical protein
MKTQFKHLLPNGRVATRNSAHAYTHVVLARANIEREVALILARDTDKARAFREREAKEAFAHATQVINAGVGGRADYVRGQGGYGKPGGFVIQQWHVDFETEWLSKRGGSEAAFIEYSHNEFRQRQAEDLQRAKSQSTDWHVLSWHHSYALADKAAKAADWSAREKRVEAINNGVRS